MFGYSLLRANANRGFFSALMDQMLAFRVPIEGLHTETGPGVYEAAIQFSGALECADRGVLFKTGAKEIGAQFGIMPSFMAKWSQHYPGCSGHLHQSLSDGKKNLFYDAKGRAGMSKLFESYLAGQVAALMQFAPMFWPTDQQLQTAGRRLLGAGEANLGDRQPNGELPGDPRVAEEHPARNTLPWCRHQSLPRGRGTVGCGAARHREESETDSQTDHRNQPGLETTSRVRRAR